MSKIKTFIKKFFSFFKAFFRGIIEVGGLVKRNLLSLHRRIWGSGWRRLLLAVLITLVVVTVLMVVSMEVTSRPTFCNTCHYMKPYYQSWLESSHRDVTCTDCHFPPGFKNKIKGKFTAFSMLVNYFTGVYKKGKPWAEIPDESCMRSGCHETRTLSGTVMFKKGIVFDHAPHLTDLRREKKLRCTSCHSQIVQGSHLSVTQSTCFLCHFKGTGAEESIHDCRKCHEPPVAAEGSSAPLPKDHSFVLEKEIGCRKCHGEMVVGDGAVPKNRCSSCHAEIEKLNQYGDTEFMHKNHITDHKIECQMCHTEIQHKSVAHSEAVKSECRACHPDFHQVQLDLFMGMGGRGVPDHPSPMFQTGLNCQACHVYHQFSGDFPKKGETLLASTEACESCHGKGYNRILNNWKRQSRKKIGQMERVLASGGRQLLTRRGHRRYGEAQKKLADATFNFNLVKHGNAVHNIGFADRLLEQSYLLTEEALSAVGLSPGLPNFDRLTQAVPGECSNCHSGVERTESEIFGWRFSHFEHLDRQKISCNTCHSNEKEHGQLVIKKSDCMGCHHQDKEAECTGCHDTQRAVYHSQLQFSTLQLPNAMAEGVSCLDCHQDEEKNLFRPGKEACTACHEEDYTALFVEWRETTANLLKILRDKVEREKLGRGDRAYDLLRFLEKDGSGGIHNPDLYETLIREIVNE